MRKGLAVADLGDLVELPLVAVLETYRRDGAVLLSPVWHEWREAGFNVVTGSDGVKGQHLRRDPRASIVVADDVPPYRGIEVRCRARLLAAGDEDAGRVAARYPGREGGAADVGAGADDP